MFTSFAKFWIENSKLTFVLIILVILSGLFSWLFLPKQYNPDIIVPAFNIMLKAPGFSSSEIEEFVVKPFENKLMEIEGVDHVYGYANKDFANVMVSFYVGVEKEEATMRLYNKIYSNLDLKPLGVEEPIIKAIDPDEIPVYTLAITSDNDEVNSELKLRKLGLQVMDKLKLVSDTSVFYLVGGEKDNINIKLDLDQIESKNVDIMQIFEILNQNNLSFPGGDIKLDQNLSQISVEGSLDKIEKVKKLIISYENASPVYLEDIALIYKGISRQKYETYVNIDGNYKKTIYIGIAKKKGTNAVFVTNNIKKELEKIELQKGYSIHEIQNEGKIAKDTTNMLIINLIQSIIIVILVLSVFLGMRNALNAAISIPLTLSIVFLFSLIIGDNINRITLFALILVLGMLVDDSTVVVENVNRHLSIRVKTAKTKMEAIFDAIKEVELGVVLSTVTRLLAFFAMFFVTGMMGEYMGPIPKYAIIAMITSTSVALSVNPFLSHFLAKNPVLKENNDKKNKSKGLLKGLKKLIHDGYFGIMHSLLGEKQNLVRKIFKGVFWLGLGLAIVLPIYFSVFKARMLPKSNQNQFYIWIDTPADTNMEGSSEITKDVNNYLSQYMDNQNNENAIIDNISYWIGLAPVPDFSNTFRGASNRQGENYISMRVNLIHSSQRSITSEEFVIYLRPLLKKFILEKYPELKIRVLEDPPGPPVRSTFLLEVAGDPNENVENIENVAKWIKFKLSGVLYENNVVDLDTSIQTYKTNYKIILDHEMVSRLGLSVKQVSYTMYSIFEGSEISIYHDKHAKEPVNIYLSVKDSQKNKSNVFDKITFTNNLGQKVPLSEIAEIVPQSADRIIYSDDRRPTIYIYGEMGDDSVIYPIVDIFRIFNREEFWDGKFELLSSGPYGFKIRELMTNKEYMINLGGEWELTMDTFRDLGTAMIITFISIFFMMVAQFRSFKIGGDIMISFLLGFLGVFPGYALMYWLNNEYFSATSMIGVIALAGIVVGNAIIFVEYLNILLKRGLTLKTALLNAGWTRSKPIFVTSLTTILGATTILGDPVWSGLALSIIFGLGISSILTTIVLPVFIYDSLKKTCKLDEECY